MEQFVLIPLSDYERFNTVGLLDIKKYPTSPKQEPIVPNVQKESLLEKIREKRLPIKHANLVLENPRVTLSSADSIIVDGTDTGIKFVDFILNINRKKKDITDIYYHILDVVGIESNSVSNEIAKNHDRGSWIPFKI